MPLIAIATKRKEITVRRAGGGGGGRGRRIGLTYISIRALTLSSETAGDFPDSNLKEVATVTGNKNALKETKYSPSREAEGTLADRAATLRNPMVHYCINKTQ
jgi:hypothetical protein